MTRDEAVTICIETNQKLRRWDNPNVSPSEFETDRKRDNWLANNGLGVFRLAEVASEPGGFRARFHYASGERTDLESSEEAFKRLAPGYWIHSVTNLIINQFRDHVLFHKPGKVVELSEGRILFSRLSDEEVKVEMTRQGEANLNLPHGGVVKILERTPLEVFREFRTYIGKD